jgi:hypothetical protein
MAFDPAFFLGRRGLVDKQRTLCDRTASGMVIDVDAREHKVTVLCHDGVVTRCQNCNAVSLGSFKEARSFGEPSYGCSIINTTDFPSSKICRDIQNGRRTSWLGVGFHNCSTFWMESLEGKTQLRDHL